MKKICIVTGASSGMGVSFAEQLAYESACFARDAYYLAQKQGGTTSAKIQHKIDVISRMAADEIWLVARRRDKLVETAASISRMAEQFDSGDNSQVHHFYPTPCIVEMDISGRDGALRMKQLIESEAAKSSGLQITVLVNNAGFGTYGEFAATDTMREMEMVDLDCTSLTGITGFALPYMAEGSRLINTASLASFLPLGNFAVYGACKSYVLSFTVALAAELKSRGIKVTALCPGPVSTEFANVASKGAREKVRHGLPPERTVAHCIKASRRGKLYSMYAFKWKFKAFMSKFVGRYTGAWFTYKFCKRPSN